MVFSRGAVVRVYLPRPQGHPGHEQFGPRPAVVVQDDPQHGGLTTTVVVPLTSNRGAMRLVNSMEVSPSPSNGLTMISVALTSQVRAIDRKRIESEIGHLSERDLKELDNCLRKHLSL